MEDISQLCKRVIIINLGEIVYDGDLQALVNKYAPYKLLTVTFNNGGVKKEELERFGEIGEYSQYKVTLKIPRDQVKEIASQILTSHLPVDDILIDEPEVDDIIRKIFGERK
jgi:ABC-2 type transport system ATP-binding protein